MSAMNRVAIVGSRDFSDLDRVREFVRSLPPGTTVVSGGARGVDRVAADEARNCGLDVLEFFADWDRFGKRAGFLRNKSIVAHSDRIVAFWDGVSKGTLHTIHLAANYRVPVEIIQRESSLSQ